VLKARHDDAKDSSYAIGESGHNYNLRLRG
jgi:hypothetical protein